MTEKTPKVVWASTLNGLRLVAIPATKYPYDTIFVFESMQKDSLGFESWRQVERITDANTPVWKFIESMMTLSGESVIGEPAEPMGYPPIVPEPVSILAKSPVKIKG